MKPKIIDRYLIKQFLQTILFGLLAFTVIFVVIDLMENLDDFIDQNVPTLIIFHYYLVFSPDIIKLMTPVAVLFSALFTAGKAANLSELTALKASGISLNRFMAPFLVTSFVISLFSIYFAGYVVPMANQKKVEIQMKYLKKDLNYGGSNIYFQDTRNRLVSIAYFDKFSDQANRVSIEKFANNDPTHIVQRIDAVRMVYDSSDNSWTAYRVVKRIFLEDSQQSSMTPTLKLTNLNFKPSELTIKQQKPEEMDLGDLYDLIQRQKRSGNNTTALMIEYYSRFAFPMASIVVVLFGLPISASKRRGSLAVHIGINILLTFIYLVFMKISQAFGKNGALDPFLTAWSANIIFLGAALINLPRVRQ
jgi:lipopolysaccharide export system permease protein